MIKKTVAFLLRISNALGHRLKRFGLGSVPGGKLLVDGILWPGDCVKSVQYYRNVFNQRPHLIVPRTFNEKMVSAKLFRRKARYICFADKLAVRNRVEQRVGRACLTKIYWTGTDLLEARTVDLPQQFVIKANHSWGTVLLVRDRDGFDWEAAQKITRSWLKDDHSSRLAEWQYRWIKPRLFIEEFLGEHGTSLPDYKFFCFHGKVGFVGVDKDRFSSISRTIVDRDFNRMPFAYGYPPSKDAMTRPSCFDEMVHMAEVLSEGEPFLRVDLYDDAGRPVFGELTLHPGSGMDFFDPPDYDEQYGRMI